MAVGAHLHEPVLLVQHVVVAAALILEEAVRNPDGLVPGHVDVAQVGGLGQPEGQSLVQPLLLEAELDHVLHIPLADGADGIDEQRCGNHHRAALLHRWLLAQWPHRRVIVLQQFADGHLLAPGLVVGCAPVEGRSLARQFSFTRPSRPNDRRQEEEDQQKTGPDP